MSREYQEALLLIESTPIHIRSRMRSFQGAEYTHSVTCKYTQGTLTITKNREFTGTFDVIPYTILDKTPGHEAFCTVIGNSAESIHALSVILLQASNSGHSRACRLKQIVLLPVAVHNYLSCSQISVVLSDSQKCAYISQSVIYNSDRRLTSFCYQCSCVQTTGQFDASE